MKAIRQFNQELYEGIKAASIIVNEKEIGGITYEKIAPIMRSQNLKILAVYLLNKIG